MPHSSETFGHQTLSAVDVSYLAPDGTPIVGPVSLSLGQETTGLIGANGVGKTTLVKMLVGALPPTTGQIHTVGRVGYLPQHIPFAADDQVRHLLGITAVLDAIARIEGGSVNPRDFDQVGTAWDIADRAAHYLEQLGLGHLGLGRQVATLSGGERVRVALAGCLLSAPDLLVLDEPTNNLDSEAREALYETLGGWSGGILVISHDRALLERVHRIAELRADGLTLFGGAWAHYVEQRAVMDAAIAQDVVDARKELATRKRDQQRALERQTRRQQKGRAKAVKEGVPKILLGAMKQSAETTTAKMGDVHADRVNKASGALRHARARVRPENEVKIDLAGTSMPSGKRVIELRRMNFAYPSGPTLFGEAGLNWHVVGPQRWSIRGPNGSGKSTLAKIILGELSATQGQVYVGMERIAWLDQNARVLTPGQPVLETFRRLNPGLDEGACRWRMSRFLLKKDDVFRPPAQLSGGERVRAAMACILGGMTPPQLLILDEPTNDLDLDTIEQVESALKAYKGALIVISHDQAFLQRLNITHTLHLPPRTARGGHN